MDAVVHFEMPYDDAERVAAFYSSAFGWDTKALGAVMTELKQRFPKVSTAAILAEPNTSYDVLVHVMDRVRAGRQVQGPKVVNVDLFPDISVGDAPVRHKQAKL